MVRVAALAGLLVATACAGGGPCRTDVDCSPREICTAAAHGEGGERRCERTCQTDLDCTLALKFGHSCRQVADGSSGPATVVPRGNIKDSADYERTARGVLRTCRAAGDAQRK